MTTDSQKRTTQTTSTTFFNRSGKPVTVTHTEYTGPLRRGSQVVTKKEEPVVRAINPTHM